MIEKVHDYLKGAIMPRLGAPLQEPFTHRMDEYATEDISFAGFLPWRSKIDPWTIENYDHSFMRTYHYRGRDLAAASMAVRNAINDQLNLLFKDYKDGWMFHVDLPVDRTTEYPKATFPDTASWLVDEENRLSFQQTPHFTSDTYITLTYLRPTPLRSKRRSLLYSPRVAEDTTSDHAAWATFAEGCAKFEHAMAHHFQLTLLGVREETEPGEGPVLYDDQFAHLHRDLTGQRQPVRAIPYGYSVREYLAPDTLHNEDILRIGQTLFWPITVIEPPDYSTPAFLDILDSIPGTMRVSWRWISRDRDKARKEIRKTRRQNKTKRKSAMDHVTNNSEALDDPEARRMQWDGEEALGHLNSNKVHFGWFTMAIVAEETIGPDETASQAAKRLRALRDIIKAKLEARGFLLSDDDGNQLETYQGTLPGIGYANVVRYMLSSRNFVNKIPTTHIWRGELTAPCEDYPEGAGPLAIFPTSGNKPFYLNLHEPKHGGHTMIIGNTGYGKSGFTGYLLNRHRQYNLLGKGARQIIIDRDFSHFTQCEAVGGTHVLVGPKTDVGFAPFAHIDDPDEMLWAEDFVMLLLRQQGLDPQAHAESIFLALQALKDEPPDHRSLSDLAASPHMHAAVREKLMRYSRTSSAGKLFDAREDTLADSSFIVFEISPLKGDSQYHLPGMVMLLHAIERMCQNGIPTLLASEEFWALLDDDIAAKVFMEWLLTMRKRNVAVIMVMQMLAQMTNPLFKSIALGSTVTKLFLPNIQAMNDDNLALYKDCNLEPWECAALADIARRNLHAVYVVKNAGRRLIEIPFGPVTRWTVATTSVDDVEMARKFMDELGQDWYPTWIQGHVTEDTGNEVEAEMWRAHAYHGPPRPEPKARLALAPRHDALHPSDPLSKEASVA